MITPISSEPFGTQTPEDLLICKDLANHLSREAQFVLLIVFNAPMESMNQVAEILRESYWDWRTIRETFKEIKRYLNDIKDHSS